MSMMKFTILLVTCLSLSALAQERERRSAAAGTATAAATTSGEVEQAGAAPARAKVHAAPGQGGPDSLATKPGTVLTLCCGSVDPHEMTGSNCAYMHTGQGCAGMILACPEGSKDTVTKDGSGYCKTQDG